MPAEPITVRLVLAISLDGRLAPPSGGAAQLGGSGDRRVLEEALAWSDAVLVGAGTLRAHRCSCLIRATDLLQQRITATRCPQPVAVVVSRTGEFPLEWPFFQQPFERHLLTPMGLVTPGFQAGHRLTPSWQDTLNRLGAQGWTQLLLLGGSQLCQSLLAQDVVDELQLTLCPRVLGGPFSWLPANGSLLPDSLMEAGAWHLHELRDLGANEVLVHYRRNRLTRS
ncbi:5-amino-6-(5-phosphoribosylamino)uracil reductase [Synechococcus sp. A18-25c]|uniref:RibD family protein n=1 Tax=Synechococcus sp. A18-25c TaxID=1866938 RepID=UPI001648971B|nr:dihydrofolate reductase family protein [Synechococcus sp. A18-25c]QNJ20925.1 5-amino-6-(5-phosphoribosylamino)uracil reductase [Synechococcus sp. A18-25c]